MINKIIFKKFANKSYTKFSNKSIVPKFKTPAINQSAYQKGKDTYTNIALNKIKREEIHLENLLTSIENSYFTKVNENNSTISKNDFLKEYISITKQLNENSFDEISILYKKGLRKNFEEMSLNFVNENIIGFYKYDNGAWGDYFRPYVPTLLDDQLEDHYSDLATHERTIHVEQKISNIVIQGFYDDNKSLDFAFYNEYVDESLVSNIIGDNLVDKSGYFEIDTLDKLTKSNENFAINENLEDTRTNDFEIGTSHTLYSYVGKYPNDDVKDNTLIRDVFNKVKGI